MKSVIALFLATYLFAGSLFPGNSFANFSELPNLMEHYLYHRNVETPGITFIQFLSLHYDNNDHSKSDADHHNKLPLHHHSSTIPLDEIAGQNRNASFSTLNIVNIETFPFQNFPVRSFDICYGLFKPPQA